jgi:hypothetical protein
MRRFAKAAQCSKAETFSWDQPARRESKHVHTPGRCCGTIAVTPDNFRTAWNRQKAPMERKSILSRTWAICSRSFAACLILVSAIPLTGCDKRDRSRGDLAQDCPASHLTDGPQKIPHPINPSECTFVVMTCHACVYKETGEFDYVESSTCGVCLKVSTP